MTGLLVVGAGVQPPPHLIPLTCPTVPACGTPHLPSWQQAECTMHTCSRCHLSRLLPPASCADGGLVRGQGAKSHSLVSD